LHTKALARESGEFTPDSPGIGETPSSPRPISISTFLERERVMLSTQRHEAARRENLLP
jgi:hypothetical protein